MSEKVGIPRRLRTKWLAALRSGEYKQTREILYDTATKGFCCLGVLEHIVLNGKVEAYKLCTSKGKKYMVPLSAPSHMFYSSCGLKGFANSTLETALINMNDEGSTFLEIADYIQANTKRI